MITRFLQRLQLERALQQRSFQQPLLENDGIPVELLEQADSVPPLDDSQPDITIFRHEVY